MSPSNADSLQETPLTALHAELGAKLVPFAGYRMPLNYPGGIIKEHLHTRAAAGLFDVSHMGQIAVRGDHAAAAFEQLVGADIKSLASGRQRYALLTNTDGGIIDDIMVSRVDDELRVVVNAACKRADYDHMKDILDPQCDVVACESLALMAVQGPQAAAALAQIDDDDGTALAAMRFMDVRTLRLAGVSCLVSRSGYSGEDGFEISLPNTACEQVARRLLAIDAVKAVGLGARDSLRLEAGLCLYGHDISAATTPVEANLSWAIAKARRPGGARAGGYPGASIIARQLADGPSRRRVGLRPEGKVAAREGAAIVAGDGDGIGKVTSGGFAPSLGVPVAMGYVDSAALASGQGLFAKVRNKPIAMSIADLPFVAHQYIR